MTAYRFIGTYTGGRDSITMFGVTFHGHEPAECDNPRIVNHPEFEAVEAAEKPKRGRPKKSADE